MLSQARSRWARSQIVTVCSATPCEGSSVVVGAVDARRRRDALEVGRPRRRASGATPGSGSARSRRVEIERRVEDELAADQPARVVARRVVVVGAQVVGRAVAQLARAVRDRTGRSPCRRARSCSRSRRRCPPRSASRRTRRRADRCRGPKASTAETGRSASPTSTVKSRPRRRMTRWSPCSLTMPPSSTPACCTLVMRVGRALRGLGRRRGGGRGLERAHHLLGAPRLIPVGPAQEQRFQLGFAGEGLEGGFGRGSGCVSQRHEGQKDSSRQDRTKSRHGCSSVVVSLPGFKRAPAAKGLNADGLSAPASIMARMKKRTFL